MFKKEKQRSISSYGKLPSHIHEADVYNSLLLYRLYDPDITRELYEITVYEHRPDLIAKDYYGSEDYLDFIMLQAKVGLEGLKKGTVLRLIPKSTLDNLINSIQ